MEIDFSGLNDNNESPAEEPNTDGQENPDMFSNKKAPTPKPAPQKSWDDEELKKLDPYIPLASDMITWQRTVAIASTATDASQLSADVKQRFSEIAEILKSLGFVLRTTCPFRDPLREYANAAFGNKVEIYKLWEKQCEGLSRLNKPTELAERIAVGMSEFKDKLDPKKEGEPKYEFIKENVGYPFFYRSNFPRVPRENLINKIHMILGADCNAPINLAIVFSPDAVETLKEVDFKVSGNIRDMLHMSQAKPLSFPVFNLKTEDCVERVKDFVKTFN